MTSANVSGASGEIPSPASGDPYRLRPADPARPSGTYTMDWINMLPLPDAAIRMYHAIRMFIFDKSDDFTVSLTNEELGALTPQANGEPRHPRSVARAIEPLVEIGLIEVVELQKISVTIPGKAKPEVRTVRTLMVRDEPKGGFAAYCGPVNPFIERKRLADVRKAERAARRAKAAEIIHRGTDPGGPLGGEVIHRRDAADDSPGTDVTDSSRHTDQGSLFGYALDTDVSAGHSDVTDLSSPRDRFVTEPGQICPVKKPTQGSNPEKLGGPAPLDPPAPAADASGTKEHGHSALVVTDQGELKSNHPHARARELAGPAAVAAVKADPTIGEDELANLIATTSRKDLTHLQAVDRAVRLLAWETAPRQSA